MTKWIPVATRLPADGVAVLAWDGIECAVAHVMHYGTGDRATWWVHNCHGFCEDGQIYDVSDWQPCPDGPKP